MEHLVSCEFTLILWSVSLSMCLCRCQTQPKASVSSPARKEAFFFFFLYTLDVLRTRSSSCSRWSTKCCSSETRWPLQTPPFNSSFLALSSLPASPPPRTLWSGYPEILWNSNANLAADENGTGCEHRSWTFFYFIYFFYFLKRASLPASM